MIDEMIYSPTFVNLTHMMIEIDCDVSYTDMEFEVLLNYDGSQFYYSGANI